MDTVNSPSILVQHFYTDDRDVVRKLVLRVSDLPAPEKSIWAEPYSAKHFESLETALPGFTEDRSARDRIARQVRRRASQIGHTSAVFGRGYSHLEYRKQIARLRA